MFDRARFGRYLYGDAGDIYPVEFGDIWEAGPHLVACGDVELGAVEELCDGVDISLTYTDPPWEQRGATLFRRKAGISSPVDYPTFLARVVQAVTVACEMWIEIGLGSAEMLLALMRDYTCSVEQITSGTPVRPIGLLRAFRPGASVLPELFGPEVGAMHGNAAANMVIVACSVSGAPGAVLDPCAGLGTTPLLADEFGLSSVSNELHPRRAAVILQKLDRRGHTPRKIGSLRSMEGVYV